MTMPTPGSKEVTIYLPSKNGTPEPLHLELPQMPDVHNMTLQQALFGQLKPWGLARTLDAYRRAIESGVNVLASISAFYEAQVAVDIAKERWRNIGTIRQAEKLKIDADLANWQSVYTTAIIGRNEAQIKRAIAEDRLANIDLIIEEERKNREFEKEIGALNRATALNEARLKKEETERKLAGRQAGEGGNSFEDMMKQREEAVKNFALLEKRKAEDIKKYGSKESMPEFIQAWYDQLEDCLFRKTE